MTDRDPHWEDELGRALGRAMSGQHEAPVDVAALTHGARSRAGRLRRRRAVTVGVGVAVLVLGLPVVALRSGLLTQQRSEVASSAAASPAQPDATGPGAVSASPSPASGSGSGPDATQLSQSTGPALRRTTDGLVLIPDSAVLQSADLPGHGLVRDLDLGQFRDVSTTVTRICADQPSGLAAAQGGRRVGYVQHADQTDQWTLDSTVRVFSGNGARQQLDWLRTAMGSCAGPWNLHRASVEGVPGDGAVLGYQVGLTPALARSIMVIGVVRQGRVTAGIELIVPASAAADTAQRVALATASGRDLLTRAQQRLVACGLAAQAAADPALS